MSQDLVEPVQRFSVSHLSESDFKGCGLRDYRSDDCDLLEIILPSEHETIND